MLLGLDYIMNETPTSGMEPLLATSGTFLDKVNSF